MPRFGNFWNAYSIQFFNKSHAAWLQGDNANHTVEIGALAQLNELTRVPAISDFYNTPTITNPYLAIAILFGDINALRLLIPHFISENESNLPLQVQQGIMLLAGHLHGDGLFVSQLCHELHWSNSRAMQILWCLFPTSPLDNQKAEIAQYKDETKDLKNIFIQTNWERLSRLLDYYVHHQDPENENELVRAFIEFHDHPEIFRAYGNLILKQVILFQNSRLLTTLFRIPNLNLEEMAFDTSIANTVSLPDFLRINFPAGLVLYERRDGFTPLTARDVIPDTSPFSDSKIESFKAQFREIQDFNQIHSQHIIEQIRFIERYASHPELITALLPQIHNKCSPFVLSAALQALVLDDASRSQLQSSLIESWGRGYNIYEQNSVVAMQTLSTDEKEAAVFVLDYYLDSTREDKLQKIVKFLEHLFIPNEGLNSVLLNRPGLLQRLIAYADQVDNEGLTSLVDSIPAIRALRSPPSINLPDLGPTSITITGNINASNTTISMNQSFTIGTNAPSLNLGNLAANIVSEMQQQAEESVQEAEVQPQVDESVQEAEIAQATEELCKSLRELIHAAENEPILKFLQTNKAPEIYNNFPMPRHTIFVLLHYVMHHKNIAILCALLDVKGLEHQGIGPYNETIHQFFARYFGPASKTPWAEAITLVTEKISPITMNSETQIEYKPRTLLQATMLGDLDFVRKCLDALRLIPLAINFADLHTKETALIIAVKNKDVAIIKEIVASKNCQVNLKDREGNTAFMLAAAQGSRDIIELLREKHKVDITIKNNQHKNAAILANDNGYSDLAGDLLQLIQDAEIENEKAEAEDKRRKEYSESLDGYTKRMQDIGMLDQFPEEFLDPVSGKIMMEPITLDDGYTFDKSTLAEQIRLGKKYNPHTKENLPDNVLQRQPTKLIKAQIEAKVLEFEKAHAAKQNKNQDDDNDVDDKVTMPKLG